MATWTDQPEGSAISGLYFLLIDDTHYFLIDDSFMLTIEEGSVPPAWTDQLQDTGGTGDTFQFLIDDDHFLLIDGNYQLTIGDDTGPVSVVWTDNIKN